MLVELEVTSPQEGVGEGKSFSRLSLIVDTRQFERKLHQGSGRRGFLRAKFNS